MALHQILMPDHGSYATRFTPDLALADADDVARIFFLQLLDHAAEHGHGVPAFNISNMEQGMAIMAAADACNAPVILQARWSGRFRREQLFARCCSLRQPDQLCVFMGGWFRSFCGLRCLLGRKLPLTDVHYFSSTLLAVIGRRISRLSVTWMSETIMTPPDNSGPCRLCDDSRMAPQTPAFQCDASVLGHQLLLRVANARQEQFATLLEYLGQPFPDLLQQHRNCGHSPAKSTRAADRLLECQFIAAAHAVRKRQIIVLAGGMVHRDIAVHNLLAGGAGLQAKGFPMQPARILPTSGCPPGAIVTETRAINGDNSGRPIQYSCSSFDAGHTPLFISFGIDTRKLPER